MSGPVIGTSAVDVDCPRCSCPAGERCGCQARVNLAAKITREANARHRADKLGARG